MEIQHILLIKTIYYPKNIYYCVNTLIICTNNTNIGKDQYIDPITKEIRNTGRVPTVNKLYEYMKTHYPYFDDENVDTWNYSQEFKKPTINGQFPILDTKTNPLYKSKEYNFIIFHTFPLYIETHYVNKNYIFGILLYLKLGGYIIFTAMHINSQNSLKKKLIQKWDNNTYLRVVHEHPDIEWSSTYNNNLFTVLQKISELNENDKEKAKEFCNWKS